ncbi:uncharacterized protein LOC114828329 [Galendromus occidentalis]|uniref:Uncharacterized protein LOC114828329 n=1 Tax=Galendromus occidentalis TaxID=34638 RepID=A0AAJ7WJ44_9ACAR|nr:uncharacterized protein LOC114828329 [Galendromus occidentalis]
MQLLSAIFLSVSLTSASEVKLMESFDHDKITGTWLVAKRNAQLLKKSYRCVKVELVHAGEGKDFVMHGNWIDEEQTVHNNTFIVIEDQSHPAQFVFKSDVEKIALSFLGSDYTNWAVAFGKVLLKESYFVAYRKLPADPAFAPAIEEVLRANNVGLDFLTIDHSNC